MQTALEALPGVRSVAFTRNALLSGSTSITGIYRPGQAREQANDIHVMSVSPEFFETHARSRCCSAATSTSATSPTPDGLGDHQRDGREEVLRRTRTRSASASARSLEESGKTEIIGVIRDTKYNSLRDAAPPTLYTPIRPRTRLADRDGADRGRSGEHDRDRAHRDAAGRSGRADDRHDDADRSGRRPLRAGAAVRARLLAVRRRWRCCWPASGCSG